MDLQYRVSGLRDLDEALKQFPAKLQRKYLARALRAGAKIIQQQAQANAPVKTGALRRNIVVRSAPRNGAAGRVAVGIRAAKKIGSRTTSTGKVRSVFDKRGDAFYGRFVEGGTKPHMIPRLSKRDRAAARTVLGKGTASVLKIGGRFVSVVHHPGAKSKPFLRPALESSPPRVLAAFRDELARQIAAG